MNRDSWQGQAAPVVRYIQQAEAPLEDRDEAGANTLAEHWEILKRHRRLIGIAALAGTLAGFTWMLRKPVVYTARATLELQGINENFMNMNLVDPTAGNYAATQFNIQTHLLILESDSLKQGLAERMRRMGTVTPPAPTGRLGTLRSWFGSRPDSPKGFTEQALTMAWGTLRANPIKTSRIIEIRCDSTSPELAAKLVNTVASGYIEQNLDERLGRTRSISKWVSAELKNVRGRLQESEQRLQNYVARTGIMFFDENEGVARTRLRDLEKQLSEAQGDRITKQSRYETARAASADSLPDVIDDDSLRSYQSRITELKREMAALTATLQPEHYRVQRVIAQIAEMESALRAERDNIVQRIRNEYEVAQKRERLLTGAYGRQAKLVSEEAEKAIQYSILKREAEINRQTYNTMLQQEQQANTAAAVPASNIRIIDPAYPPSEPYKPVPFFDTMLGTTFGIVLGCLLAYVREKLDSTLRLPGQVTHTLRAPELGVIPSAAFRPFRLSRFRREPAQLGPEGGLFSEFPASSIELVTWNQKPSFIAESFRSALASITSVNRSAHQRIIVFTSPNPAEGKTTLSCNLGIAMSEANRRTLLVDGDLRGPKLHKVFDLPNTWGLTTLLQEDRPVTDYNLASLAQPTKIPGLYLLPRGPAAMNVNGLLYSHRLAELLRRLRTEFDAVLIDTPPLLQFADSGVIGRLADGVVLVVRAGVTDRNSAKLAYQRLREMGAPVMGTILNDFNPVHTDARYYGRYYYGAAAS